MGLLEIVKNWQLIVIGLLFVALGASGIYISTLKAEKVILSVKLDTAYATIDKLKAEKALLVTNLEISNASIAALKTSINEQNIAVQQLKATVDAREKANRIEITKARAESAKQKKQVEDLMARIIPENTTACDAANQLFNEEIKNAK